MENSSNYFAESIAEITSFENQQSDFNLQTLNPTGPEDEEEEEEEEVEGGEQGEDADNPPLDPSIVYSPVPTQTGGKPR